MASEDKANQVRKGRPKKPYNNPKVRAYGSVLKITQATTSSGKLDSHVNNTKTQL